MLCFLILFTVLHSINLRLLTWWRHKLETFPASLALCEEKICVFWFIVGLLVKLTISQRWFIWWLCAENATSHWPNRTDIDQGFDTISQIARFMGSTWGPPGLCRPQLGPMLAPRTLLSGIASQGPHELGMDRYWFPSVNINSIEVYTGLTYCTYTRKCHSNPMGDFHKYQVW